MRRVVDLETRGMATINVTPIIDVALVLVIILMITAPMLAVPRVGLDLPVARAQAGTSEARVNVTLARDGSVAVDENVVPKDAFRRELSARFMGKGADERLLVVRADAGVPYGAVKDLLSDARAAGATRIAIATRPPNSEPGR